MKRHLQQGLTTFQIVLLSVFGFCILVGIMSFALYRGTSSKANPIVTIWGTLDQTLFDTFISKTVGLKANVYYVQKNPATFSTDLVNAVATGQGPDAILGTQDQLFSTRALITIIPYQNINERSFISTYITEGQLYLQPQGILALPLGVDPLVMYWNKVLFSNAGIATPPTTWQDVAALIKKLTVADKAYNVTQSALGMGDYVNVNNAKAIISLLLMQAGNPIMSEDYSSGSLTPALGANNTYATEAANALTFYTQFANPTSHVYSWNRALPNSQNLFIASQLAMYFGLASEYKLLPQKNPNLDFDVAIMPQLSTSGSQSITFGNLYGLAILRSSANPSTALSDIQALTSQSAAPVWIALSGLPSARLDSLRANPASVSAPIFNQSALWARGWPDPNAAQTNQIFQTMVDSVTAGQQDPGQAVLTAQNQLQSLLH